MEIRLTLLIFSLIYLFLTIIIYFSKKRFSSVENKIYERMLIITPMVIVCEILCNFTAMYNANQIISSIVAKSYLSLILIWIVIFSLYISSVTILKGRSLDEYNISFIRKCFYILGIISILLVAVLPLNFVLQETAYVGGLGVKVLIVSVTMMIIFNFICYFTHFKKMSFREKIPMIILILVIVLLLILNNFVPNIQIVSSAFCFITVLMFFTIENPDVHVIELLMRNKELVEQSVNDKSNFLFKISQELKKPIKNIIKEIKPLKESVKDPSKLETINQIENNANSAYFIINDVTDISSMDVKSFKVQENTYMTERFFADVVLNVKNQMKNDNKDDKIEFNFKINSKCPDSLFGDNIKLKQILLSIINNSIKYTKEGFIDLEVDALVRYDACRFVFTISDSGCGMPLTVVNDLMSKNEEIDTIDYQKTDNLNLRIPVVSKILKILGGNININSKEGTGTTVTIVINQEINYDSTEIVLNDVKKYNTGIKVKQRVLVADDSDNFDKVERLISKYDVELIPTLIGRDVVDKIKNGDMFDLIILRDEMEPDSAYTILKELKSIDKFKIPVIIMINREKEFIKDEFIKDGFSDYIVYEKIDNDMDRVMKKYI